MKTKQTGFSFVEVLFAVIVLAIGFIMIAAVFPVAISQTKTTTDETAAAAIARGGVNYLSQVASNASMPAAAVVGPQFSYVFAFDGMTGHGSWTSVQGSLILPTDSRYAFVPLYKRDNGSPYAQVFVIGVQAKNKPIYGPQDLIPPTLPIAYPATLQPRLLRATIVDGTPDTITFANGVAPSINGGTYTPNAAEAVGEGTYVIIAADNVPVPNNFGRMNGRIYRVGNFITGTQWELAPGNDFTADPDPDGAGTQTAINGLTNADVYIVGKTLTNPARGYDSAAGTRNQYDGPSQDIAVYTTFVRVN